MSELTQYVGQRIKYYRKERGYTLQNLANLVHKSRATISKYENGEISLDVDTLYELAQVLDVRIQDLTDYKSKEEIRKAELTVYNGMSPFFQAKTLYFYFYDGRYQRLKDGIISIEEDKEDPSHYIANLSISASSVQGRSSKIYYTGSVLYSDMLIRFHFVNTYNALEEDLLYIFNPLEFTQSTNGLLCGISSADLKPCAFKCLVTLTPQTCDDALKEQLLMTKREMQRWQKMNMLMIDNL